MNTTTSNHIPYYDNHNKPIIASNHAKVPSITFNVITISKDQTFKYAVTGYESVLVLASGTVQIQVGEHIFNNVGSRADVFTGQADSVYIPLGEEAIITGISKQAIIYAAGGKVPAPATPLPAFRIDKKDIQTVQYGSDETKTHRKIDHILGQNVAGRVHRLLVSELFTVGEGGWSGFPPHKHDTERPPLEKYFEEVYYFRFSSPTGFAAQFLYEEASLGPIYHVKDKSTFIIDKGYHPVVVAPGYRMYYFTILAGKHDRSLIQYFHPDQKDQLETIPGIKDMISAFK
ncbi:5-deoxy-glucuronate isomerase [Spirochaetota bacterium]|nr:5-deoxy-glucuronate isomerase [Spirochaetota bacterium]